MSHELTETDQIILHKQKAWHGLGEVLDHDITVEQALEKVLPWEPKAVPLVRTDDSTEVPHKAIVRNDNGHLLSVVSKGYRIIPNATVAKAVNTAFPGNLIETAGSLRGGKQIWFLVRMPELDFGAGRKGNDTMQAYGLVLSSHDRSLALQGLPTYVRVVCANTMTMALAQGAGSSERWSVKHTEVEAFDDVEVLKAVYAQADRITKGLRRGTQAAETLSRKDIDRDWLNTFFLDVSARIVGMQVKDMNPGQIEICKELVVEFATNMDHPRVKIQGEDTSAWTAYNAVTQWSCHDRRIRGDRGASNFVGRTAEINKLALDAAMEMV